MTFLSLCGMPEQEVCREEERSDSEAFKEMNDRWQVDLIVWQISPDGDYKFIMTVQDHRTKFTWLRPHTSKRAEEVARSLLPIMLCFRAPCILQSDNGREFANHVVFSLKSTWLGKSYRTEMHFNGIRSVDYILNPWVQEHRGTARARAVWSEPTATCRTC